VAVLVGAVVAVGKGVALGAGVDVGADAGAQADKIRLTSKNTSNVRFILRVLLWWSSHPTARASAAAKRAQASEACRLKSQVGRLLSVPNKCIIKCLKDCIIEEFRIASLIKGKRFRIGKAKGVF
jgi:hypothetical protein